jgi:hypothetical protein
MEASGELHIPAVFHPRKDLPVPFNTRLGGTQKFPGRYGEEKSLPNVHNQISEYSRRSPETFRTP